MSDNRLFSETTIRVLDGARKILLRDGWCQRSMFDEEGRHCIAGAVHTALCELALYGDRWGELYTLVMEYLNGLARESDPTLESGLAAEWNDKPAQSVAGVLRLLDVARGRVEEVVFA